MTLTSTNEKNEMSIEKRPDEMETELSKSTKLIIQIAGAGIFGALSLLLSLLTTPYLPRNNGFAYFDPVSITWVMCFLVFGPLSGALCSFIGMFALMPFDSWTPIGPIMKFLATISLLLPYLVYSIYKLSKKESASAKIKKPHIYIILGVLGVLIRLIVMNIANAVVWVYVLSAPVNALGEWLVFVSIMNPIQSIWDLLIPYLLIFGVVDYGFRLDEKFELW